MASQNYFLAYRKKHPRCRYCIFRRRVTAPLEFGGRGYNECILKDKPLRTYYLSPFLELQGVFCKWFQPREVE